METWRAGKNGSSHHAFGDAEMRLTNCLVRFAKQILYEVESIALLSHPLPPAHCVMQHDACQATRFFR